MLASGQRKSPVSPSGSGARMECPCRSRQPRQSSSVRLSFINSLECPVCSCRTVLSGESARGTHVRLLVFLVPINILRRTLAHPLDDPGVLDAGRRLIDALDVDLVPPVVAEVEPVAEAFADL